MARKAAEEAPRMPRRMVALYLVAPFVVVSVLVAGFVFFHRVERFFLTDTRFLVPAPPEYGQDPPTVTVVGIKHASKAQVHRVFEADFGRSLYRFPVAERRRNLLAVDWVKEVTVARRWPNSVYVAVYERDPVAFAAGDLKSTQPTRYQLIDEDGVLLPVPRGVTFNVPVLIGVTEDQPEKARRDRVHRLMQLMKDVGSLGERISEVDVQDVANLGVVLKVEDRSVNLLMGDQNFKKRMQNFLRHYPGMRKRVPNAHTFDLRIEGQITAIEGEKSGEQTGE